MEMIGEGLILILLRRCSPLSPVSGDDGEKVGWAFVPNDETKQKNSTPL